MRPPTKSYTRIRVCHAKLAGRTLHAISVNGSTPLYEFDTWQAAGTISGLYRGEENLYFEWRDDTGRAQRGYCKLNDGSADPFGGGPANWTVPDRDDPTDPWPPTDAAGLAQLERWADEQSQE